MILVDANVLVEAHMAGPRHERVRQWLDDRLWGTARVGLPWPSLLAFLRLVTNPRIFARPQTVPAALAEVRGWLGCDPVWIPAPTERHAEVLGGLLEKARSGGNLVPDAHLAALAIEHGLTLCTLDHGFARFKGLRCASPLD
jgi:toxin-antitoxin system PIN domain toxin